MLVKKMDETEPNTRINGFLENGEIDFSDDFANFLNNFPNSAFNTRDYVIKSYKEPNAKHVKHSYPMFTLHIEKRSAPTESLSQLAVVRDQTKGDQTDPSKGDLIFHSNTFDLANRRKGYSKILKGVLANLVKDHRLGARFVVPSVNPVDASKNLNSKYLGMVPFYPDEDSEYHGWDFNNIGTVENAVATFNNYGPDKYCQQCGAPFGEGDSFCGTCGNKRDGADTGFVAPATTHKTASSIFK